jgi:hypothetical protein
LTAVGGDIFLKDDVKLSNRISSQQLVWAGSGGFKAWNLRAIFGDIFLSGDVKLSNSSNNQQLVWAGSGGFKASNLIAADGGIFLNGDKKLSNSSVDQQQLVWDGAKFKLGGATGAEFTAEPTKISVNKDFKLGTANKLSYGDNDHLSFDSVSGDLLWNNNPVLTAGLPAVLSGRMALWCSSANPATQDCTVAVNKDTSAPQVADGGLYVNIGQEERGGDSSAVSIFLNRIAFAVDGNIHVNAGLAATNWYAKSDRRLKTHISPLRSDNRYSELIRSVKPVTWQWKKDGKSGIGFIAQELMQAGLTELVNIHDDPNMSEQIDANGFKSPAGKVYSVNYDGMTAFLVGAQSESIQRLDRLEKWMNSATSPELRKTIEMQSILLNTQGKDLLTALTRVERLENNLIQTQSDTMRIGLQLKEIVSATESDRNKLTELRSQLEQLNKDAKFWENQFKDAQVRVDKFMNYFENVFEYTEGKDKSRLVLKTPELKVNNLTADRMEAAAIRTKLLEAETARIKSLEAEQITANDARVGRVYSGSKDIAASDSAVLFELPADGQHFVLTISGTGVYYTATVIRVDGVARVTPLSASPNLQTPDIQVYSDGPRLQVNTAGRPVKASWVRMS